MQDFAEAFRLAFGLVAAMDADLVEIIGLSLRVSLTAVFVAALLGMPLGALLGVFLLGVLTERVSERDAIVGMGAGLSAVLYVTFATPVAWTWYVVVGACVTFLAAWLSSHVLAGRR